MHEVLVNRFGGLSLPKKCVVRLTDRPDMTLDVYRGRKTTVQQQQQIFIMGGQYAHLCLLTGWPRALKHPGPEVIKLFFMLNSIEHEI